MTLFSECVLGNCGGMGGGIGLCSTTFRVSSVPTFGLGRRFLSQLKDLCIMEHRDQRRIRLKFMTLPFLTFDFF